MVREKDACWAYAEKLDGNKLKCKFCLRILNGGVSRLKHHLSRLPSKGVNPCAKVRDDVSQRVRAILLSREDSKEPSNSKKQRQIEAISPLSISTGKTSLSLEEPSPNGMISPLVDQIDSSPANNEQDAERSIALFFFENKLDFTVAKSLSYQLMIDAVSKCTSGFVPPSTETLKTMWLEKIKSEISFQSKHMEKEWARTGCTILAETWTDNKSRAFINFFISSPSMTFFQRSVDVSSYFQNVKCLLDLFDSVIQDFGPENVVQIIVDGTLDCTSVVDHILQNYGSILVSPCASYCLNTILDEFSKVDWIRRCITQVQVISKFIYNNTLLLDLMKKYTGGQEFIRTGVTKSVSDFLSLQSMLKYRTRLKQMFNSPKLTSNPTFANKPQSVACISILDDNDFWSTVEECVALSEPVLKVMKEVYGGKPAVGFLYELMTKAKEAIRTYYIMDEIKCKTFLDIVDEKWTKSLYAPLHSAAAFLNPAIQYNLEIKFLASIKEDFYKVLEKLLPTPESRREIPKEILLFTRATGIFGCTLAKESILSIPPGIWWEQYGDGAPVLQRIAIRILSQVCSTFTSERQWSTFQQLHTEKHNKIDKEALSDLVYVNYNLKLTRSLTSKTSESDTLQLDDIDMTSEWVEESETPCPTSWLDRFGSNLDGNDLNARQFGSSIFGANDPIFGL